MERSIAYTLKCVGCPSLSLKPEQKACVSYICDGKDVFLWLPTGFGKSICYEVLLFMFDMKLDRVGTRSLVIVSPLVSLMIDQACSLRSRGVKVAVMSSGSGVEKDLIATDDDLSNSSLLFCAPEAILSTRWREATEKPEVSCRVVAVVVDEAHCVSQWYNIV